MKLRFVAFITIVSIILSLISGCTTSPEPVPPSSGAEESDVSSSSSIPEESSKPEPEPEPAPEPDFFTKRGQGTLPSQSTINDCLVPSETENLYSLPLDFSEAENAEVDVKGDYIHVFYWDYGYHGKILSLDTGETLCHIDFNDNETYGSLDNGCVWIAVTYELNIRILYPDGRFETVLNEKEFAEENIVNQMQISDDGKYVLALLDNKDYVIFNLETKERITADIKTNDYYWEWHWLDGKFVIESSNGSLIYINPENGDFEKVYLDYTSSGIRGDFFYHENESNLVLFTHEDNTEYYCLNVKHEVILDVRFGFAVTQQYSDFNILKFYNLRNNAVFKAELPYDGFVTGVKFTDSGNIVIAMQMYGEDKNNFKLYVYDLPAVSAKGEGETYKSVITTFAALWQEIDNIALEIETETKVDILYGAEGNDFDNYSYMGKAEKDVFAVYSAMTAVKDILYRYPKGMLYESYSETHKGLQIYLCGDIYGMGYGSLEMAGGLTTESDGYIVVVLDINNNLEYDLPHELSHVFDRRIEYVSYITGNNYMDMWTGATPLGNGYMYTYDDYYSYNKYTVEYEDTPADVWFLTPYSRTYPTEDRAQIMEHLFNPEGDFAENILKYDNIKTKARLYCKIIRQCFDSCKNEDVLYWETLLQE